MKLRNGIFLLIIGLQFMACGVTPLFDEKDLEGNWQRVSSTDPRSDSMIVHIEGSTATITSVPMNSSFVVGSSKWIGITPVVEPGDFQFNDLGADNNYWRASIKIISETSFWVTNLDYPDAPGGKQQWIKL